MLNDHIMLEQVRAAGFSHVGKLEPSALHFLPEVREMCAADRCHSYGKTWVCPPACGTLEEITAKAKLYTKGILMQSTGQLEDDFDIETMQETEQLHKKRFAALTDWCVKAAVQALPMAAGGCTLCAQCTYPDAPCRFPQRAVPSMEAYGLWVSKVCEDSGLPYYYGPRTITYTSCVLYK